MLRSSASRLAMDLSFTLRSLVCPRYSTTSRRSCAISFGSYLRTGHEIHKIDMLAAMRGIWVCTGDGSHSLKVYTG